MNITLEIEDLEQLTMTKIKKHEANNVSSSTKHSMLVRTISALVGVAILVPAIALGDWIYFGLTTIALAVACGEILSCAKKKTVLIYIVYFLFVSLMTYWPVLRELVKGGLKDSISQYFEQLHLSIIVITVGMFLVFFLTVIYKDFTVQDACFLITMSILVGFGFQCLLYLRYSPTSGMNITSWTYTVDNTIRPSLVLIYVLFSTFMTDIGAYFTGVFFGKNKINERISPNKTWEGFIGGIIISFIFSSALGIGLAAGKYPLTDYLTLPNWYYIILCYRECPPNNVYGII